MILNPQFKTFLKQSSQLLDTYCSSFTINIQCFWLANSKPQKISTEIITFALRNSKCFQTSPPLIHTNIFQNAIDCFTETIAWFRKKVHFLLEQYILFFTLLALAGWMPSSSTDLRSNTKLVNLSKFPFIHL